MANQMGKPVAVRIRTVRISSLVRFACRNHNTITRDDIAPCYRLGKGILPDIPGVCNHSFSLELHEIDHIRNHADKHCHHQIGDYNDRTILDLVLFNSLFFFRDQFFFRC